MSASACVPLAPTSLPSRCLNTMASPGPLCALLVNNERVVKFLSVPWGLGWAVWGLSYCGGPTGRHIF